MLKLAATFSVCIIASATNLLAADDLDAPVVFVQLPTHSLAEQQGPRADGMLRADYGEGGRIVQLDPDGTRHQLTEGFHSAAEFDVSFDGKHILFAGKRRADDPWDIWEMNHDGSEPRRITRDVGNCRSPAYQATLYTIVSTEPWFQIMFVSDAAGKMNEYGSGPATSLYSCRLDGSALRRLTVNLSDDLDPYLMRDGRVLHAGWQRMDLKRGLRGRVALFGVNTDGADYALYCADQGRRIKHMPCETSDGRVVFVESDSVGWDGSGQLGAVSVRRPLYTYKPLTSETDGVLYHSPAPLPNGEVLVAARPAGGEQTHGLYRFDPESGKRELIYDDQGFHDIHARLLAPRKRPDGRSSVVNEKFDYGRLYCLNTYLTDPDIIPQMRPGIVRKLRVIEGMPVPADQAQAYQANTHNEGMSGPGSTTKSLPPVVPKRLLGVVPVKEDGSFFVELPPDVPVQLQTLDEDGLALRRCGWIWVKHRERRGCIGCHEDPELTPENRFVLAVREESMKLTLLPSQRRTVDFKHDVMPIVDRKCASCHQGNEGPLDLRDQKAGAYNRAYVDLVSTADGGRDDTAPVVGDYVHPGQARTSPLIWRLFGRNTSRPWDAGDEPTKPIGKCPPESAQPLTDDERLTFIEWVDLGGAWDSTSWAEPTDPSETGKDTSE